MNNANERLNQEMAEMLEDLHRAGKMLDVPTLRELCGVSLDEELSPLSVPEIKVKDNGIGILI